jgi:protein-L-isoaspartate(D-aspartate) O-methyltransferase
LKHIDHELTKSNLKKLFQVRKIYEEMYEKISNSNIPLEIECRLTDAKNSYESCKNILDNIYQSIVKFNTIDYLKFQSIFEKLNNFELKMKNAEKDSDITNTLYDECEKIFTDAEKDFLERKNINSFDTFLQIEDLKISNKKLQTYIYENQIYTEKDVFTIVNKIPISQLGLFTDIPSLENEKLFSKLQETTDLELSKEKKKLVTSIMISTNRKEFLSPTYSDFKKIYHDTHQSIGYNTTISPPNFHYMTLLYIFKYLPVLKPKMKCLDIGCGSGFFTLCLSKLLGSNSTVFAIDHIEELVKFTEENIRKSHASYINTGRIKFKIGDGLEGMLEEEPFDIIHFGAGYHEVPKGILDQLSLGGLIWIPFGHKGKTKQIKILRKNLNGNLEEFDLINSKCEEITTKEEQLKSK